MSDEKIYDIAGKNIEKWRLQMEHPELYRPIPTGLKELDRWIGGILEGAYYVLGGPHKSAKTTLALQLGMRLAAVDRGRVDYFQLEEIKESMATRALVHGTQRVDRTKIRDLTLGEEDFKDLEKSQAMLKNINLFVEDNEGSAKKICSLAAEHEAKFVIVDYLQLMWDNATGQQNESTRLESISRTFIKERNASVNAGHPRTFIVVYQLNEQGKAHGTRTVYKDCDGAIEIVPSEDKERGESIEGSIDLHILPGRVWQGGHTITLGFSGAHSLIKDEPILDLTNMQVRNAKQEEMPL